MKIPYNYAYLIQFHFKILCNKVTNGIIDRYMNEVASNYRLFSTANYYFQFKYELPPFRDFESLKLASYIFSYHQELSLPLIIVFGYKDTYEFEDQVSITE